jgi:hypothetical protein
MSAQIALVVFLGLLASLSLLFLCFTARVQQLFIMVAKRVPRLMLWPFTVEYYQGRFFLWVLRVSGIGCALGALRVLLWLMA